MIYELLHPMSVDAAALVTYLEFVSDRTYEPHTRTVRHHILPKSLFPQYKDLRKFPWNKAKLSHPDHVLAHWWLHQALQRSETGYSLHRMKNGTDVEMSETGEAFWNGVEFQLSHSVDSRQRMADAFEEADPQRRATCIERYGVDHYNKTVEFAERFQQTMNARHGVDHALQVPEFKAKQEQTMLERFGSTNPMDVPELVQKQKQTTYDNHGVENPMHCALLKQKCQDSRKTNCPNTSEWTEAARSKARETNKQTCLAVGPDLEVFRAPKDDPRFQAGDLIKYAALIVVTDVVTRRGYTKSAWTRVTRSSVE